MSDSPAVEPTLPVSTENQFRLLVAGVVDYAILALYIDGVLTTWNEGAERIKG